MNTSLGDQMYTCRLLCTARSNYCMGAVKERQILLSQNCIGVWSLKYVTKAIYNIVTMVI